MKKTYYVVRGEMSGQLYRVSDATGFTAVSQASDATQFSSIPNLTRGVQAASKAQRDNFYFHIVKIEETPGIETPGKETRELVQDHKGKAYGSKYVVHVGQSWIQDDGWDQYNRWTVNLHNAKLYDTLDAAMAAWSTVKERGFDGLAVSFERVKITKEPAKVGPPVITETILA